MNTKRILLLLLVLLQLAVYAQTKGTISDETNGSVKSGMPKREFVIALHAIVNTDKTGKNLIK